MGRVAFTGANLVTIAVRLFCLKYMFLKQEIVIYKY